MVIIYDVRKNGKNAGSKVYTTIYEGFDSMRQLQRCRSRHVDSNPRVVSAISDAQVRFPNGGGLGE